ISDRLHTNFEIRYAIFKRKFMIKFVNNFINQLTPFLFYAIGGYLVIVNSITFGSLVAVIAAYKDLASPWKELLNYYQNLMDVRVKYDSVIENFDPPDIYPVERLVADADDGPRLTGKIEFSNVGYSAGGGQELSDASLRIDQGSTVAVVGHDGSGRTELLQLAAGLISPNSGKVTIGGQETDNLPEARLGRDIAFVDRSAFIFTDTIRGNLHYGVRNRPVRPEDTHLDPATRDYRRSEAEATNNTAFDINAGWEDMERIGAVDHSDLDRHTIEILNVVGLSDDIYRLGMRMRLRGSAATEFRDRILRARKEITARISADSATGDLVEIWTPDQFLRSAPLMENLLFALPTDPDFAVDDIAADKDVLEAIAAANLGPELHRIGLAIAETMVDLFAEVNADNQLLAAFSFIKPDELPQYDRMVKKARAGGIDALDEDQRSALIGLAFQLVPAKHRLGLIDDALAERFVAARAVFQKRLSETGRYAFFDPGTYVEPLSIEENLLFGKIKLDRRGARERVDAFVDTVIREIDLREPIMRRGLDFHAGVAGSRLTGGQKSRIALARALLKQPNILLFDDVITPDAADDRAILTAITKHRPDCTVLVGVERLDDPGTVDQIVTMKSGRIAQNEKTQRQSKASTEPAQ
ncbi:MAG: ABC transporter ATP-binding protein, partial [Hyphomicrobiales bacterium]|nr:ABC transporter ATP-binding protein [Hyphomicrobiales bacterium]